MRWARGWGQREGVKLSGEEQLILETWIGRAPM